MEKSERFHPVPLSGFFCAASAAITLMHILGSEGQSMTYAENYVVVAIFFILGLALPAAAFTLGRLLRPHRPTAAKGMTYESGIDPVGGGWVQYNVRYYLFALLFVLFDVETVFLYPWAVVYDALRGEIGLFVLFEMLIFVALLVIGLIYAWKKKVLEWT